VAESSLAYDLGVKVPLHARHGIPEGCAEQDTLAAGEPLSCLALPGDATNPALTLPLG